MKQVVVKLSDVRLIEYNTVGGASTFTQPVQLDPNYFRYTASGAFAGSVPQRDIWNQYADMYEYWMVEKLELIFHPVTLDVETTATGIQDTCTWPTVGAKDSDTQQVFWSPATSIAVAQNQMSALAAKKGFKVTPPRSQHRLQSTVANTLLMKQDAPMLKTNGSVSAREEYSTDAGSLVMLPARNPADRSLVGLCEFSIVYRFAGVHQPGVAHKSLSSQNDENYSLEIKSLNDRISQLTALLGNLGVRMDQAQSSIPKIPKSDPE